MSKISALRKVRIAARIVGQQAGRNRTVNAVMSGARTAGRSFGRAAHQLWLEVTGLFFLIMALSFAGATFREYEKYHAGSAGFGRIAITIGCALTFGWFGVSSFWKARRKS